MSFGEIAGKILGGMGPGLLSGIGSALTPDAKPAMIPDAPDPKKPSTAKPNSFKDGGTVQKTGLALVHKGEKVIPVNKTDDVKLSHHRVVMHLNHGGLHRALGIPEGQKIPDDKLEAARSSANPHLQEMANLAHTMKSWKKK